MNDLLEKAALLLEKDREVKDLKERLKKAEEERDDANLELTDIMLDNETQSIDYKGKKLYLISKPYVNAVKEREEEFFEALRKHSYADIIRPTVNSRTLSATVTNEIMTTDENGNSVIPEWIQPYLNIYTETKVAIRKG